MAAPAPRCHTLAPQARRPRPLTWKGPQRPPPSSAVRARCPARSSRHAASVVAALPPAHRCRRWRQARRRPKVRPRPRSRALHRSLAVPYHSALRARALPQPYPSALHARRVLRHLRALGQRPVPHPGGAARAHVRQRARGHVRAADAVAAQHHAARQVHLPVRPRACQPGRLHGRQTAVFRVVAGSSAWAGCGASVPAELHAAVCGQRICLLPRHGSAGPSGAAPRANTGRGCWVGVGGWGVGGEWGGWRGLDVPQVWRALVAPGTAACGPV